MLNLLVNQGVYRHKRGRNSYQNRYEKGFSLGSLLFFIMFLGVLFLAAEGLFLLLPKDGEEIFFTGKDSVSGEAAAQRFLGIPGISYAKNDLPLAHSWRGGDIVLAWATPHVLGSEGGRVAPNGVGNGNSGGEDASTLPVVPGTDSVREEDILAARAEFRDMAPIGIYCTHTTESYIPTYGVAKASGERGGIYDVALALKDSLAKRGIPAVVSDTIHDYPDWELSYSNSSLGQAEKGVDYLADAIETVLLAEKLEEKKQPKTENEKTAEPKENPIEKEKSAEPKEKDGLLSGNDAMKMIKVIE